MRSALILKLLNELERYEISDYHMLADLVKQSIPLETETQILITSGHKIVYLNEQLCRLLNYDCEEMILSDIRRFIPREDHEILYSWTRRVTEKRYVSYMLRGVTGNGDCIWIKVSTIYITRQKLFISLLKKVGYIPVQYFPLN